MSQHAHSEPAGESADGPASAARTVEREGVRVRRAVDADTHEVPVVQYRIESDRSEPTPVRILDSLPGAVDPGHIGFHDEYHGDDWTVEDEETLAFEREVDAEGRVTTLFGVRQDPGAFESAESPPVLRIGADANDAGTAPDVAVGESETAADDGEAAVGGSDGPADGGDDSFDEDPPTLKLDDPTADFDDVVYEPDGPVDDDVDAGVDSGDARAGSDEPGASLGEHGDASAARGDASGDASSGPVDESPADELPIDETPVDADSVAGALLAELRDGRLEDGEREALRRALGLHLSESTSAFVQHVQTRLHEKRERIEAEIQTLEGSVQELYGLKADSGEVERLADRIESVDDAAVREDQFQQLERLVTHLSEAKADLERLEAAEDAVAELRAETADAERVDDLESELREVDDRTADVERVADAEAAIERLEASTAAVETAERLDAEIEALGDEKADAERLDALAERVDRKADAEALADLRETVERKAEGNDLDRLGDAHDSLEERAAMAAEVDERLADLRESKADAESVEASLEELREGKADVWTIDQVRNRIDELDAETPDPEDLDRLTERVDLAHEEKANRAAVEDIERRLEDEFVAEEDVSATIEGRLDSSIHATVSLGVAFSATVLAGLLAVQNPAEPVSALVTFLVGVVAAAFWKYQQPAVDAAA